MDLETLTQREHAALMQTYGRFPVALDHGEGCYLYDLSGKRYLDLTSGIGVNALGQKDAELVEAISTQAAKLMQASNLFYTEPMVDAAEMLKALTGLDKVFFANSGAEANEGMIKLARKYSADKYGSDRTKILTLKNSFHGRTVATLEATGQDHFHKDFYPFTGGFDYVEANDLTDLEQKMADPHVAAIMMELVQGESGVRPLDWAFVKRAKELCDEKDILFLVDEVQTGIGRTGTFYAWQQYDIVPDIMTTAKALGGGLPMGAMISGPKACDVLSAGDHGTTAGGNPLSCAAARVVLSRVGDPVFLAHVQETGAYFREEIRKLNKKSVKDVRGLGLMIGIEVGPENVAGYLAGLRDKGVLTLKAGTGTIRLLPPLILTKAQVDEAVQAMSEVLE